MCITLCLISVIPFVFPTLIIESTIDLPRYDVNYFELGNWGIPLIIFNLIFFSFLILYKLKKLPTTITNFISLVTTNDLSPKLTIVILLVLFSLYVIFSIDEFEREEFELGDYRKVKQSLVENNLNDYLNPENFSISTAIRFSLLKTSLIIFDNIRIIPFIASVSLLLITYFLTLELTKKRLSSVISMGVLMQSNLFLLFDTTATYENFWTVFYFLSLYLILKKPIGSGFSFILSMMSKPLSITFLPINLFAIFRNNISLNNKIILIISYSAIIIIIIIAYVLNLIPSTQNLVFDYQKFIVGFNELSNALRFDGLIILLFIPTVIILSIQRSKISKNTEIILVGILFMLISQPLLNSLTEISIMPYRFIPFLVFISIGIGMIFANTKNQEVK